jgi:hypothetical protein
MPRVVRFSRRRRALAAVAVVSALAGTGLLASPTFATSRPVWGVVPTGPGASEARSAATYAKPWGQLRLPLPPTVPVSAVRAPVVGVGSLPTDANSVLLRKVLNTSLKYTLKLWYPAHFATQMKAPVLDFGGTDEMHIRGPAMEAYALASALRTGAYDPKATGVPTATARAVTIQLATSLAMNHVATSRNGWGRVWQSRLWVAQAGTAAWFVWGGLSTAAKTAVLGMVASEAHDVAITPVPYYHSVAGAVNFPGDSKAEEDSWDSMELQLALAMMPTAAEVPAWASRNAELLIASYSRPQDLTDNTIVNGLPVSEWLHGSNANANGSVTNHGIVHPDYMATLVQSLTAPIIAGFAGTPAPQAALWNAAVVYGDMTSLTFTAPPWNAPGGTIYVPGSWKLYYPQGDDWGTGRDANYVALDELAADFGVGTHAATTELTLHLQRAAAMQARSKTGQSYVTAGEDIYKLREEWVAYHFGLAWLGDWVTANHLTSFTNAAMLPVASERAPG